MRRWIKRISLVLAAVVLVIAVVGAVYYRQASRVPDWYTKAKVARVDHNTPIEQSVIPLQNWANRNRAGDPATKPEADKRHTMTITADQINALIGNWGKTLGIEDRIAQHARDIRVRIADGKVTIAADVVEYGKVLSIILEPVQNSDGYAGLKLASMEVGNARMPLVAFQSRQSQFEGFVGKLARDSKDRVEIDDHGDATSATASLYYTALAADLFAGESPDAFAFLKYGTGSKTLATRVREVKIVDDKLTMTLETLAPAQREALVDRLKSLGDPKPDASKE